MIQPVANCRQITVICQKFITSCFGLTVALVGLIIKMCNFLHILQKALITGFVICDFFAAFWRWEVNLPCSGHMLGHYYGFRAAVLSLKPVFIYKRIHKFII